MAPLPRYSRSYDSLLFIECAALSFSVSGECLARATSPPLLSPTSIDMSAQATDSIPDDIKKHNDFLRSLRPLDPSTFPFSPIPSPPSLGDVHWSVTAIRTGNIVEYPSQFLVEGPHDKPTFNLPVFAFLLERVRSGKTERVLFELGLRNVSTVASSASYCPYLYPADCGAHQ